MFLEDGKEKILQTAPGDYIFVPPYTPHREENPSPDVPGSDAPVLAVREPGPSGPAAGRPDAAPCTRAGRGVRPVAGATPLPARAPRKPSPERVPPSGPAAAGLPYARQ